MEERTGFLGISGTAWGVIGIVAPNGYRVLVRRWDSCSLGHAGGSGVRLERNNGQCLVGAGFQPAWAGLETCPLYFIRWCYYKEWTGMKLFLPRGDIAWFVDKFSRSVHRIVGHRTVSTVLRIYTYRQVLQWRAVSALRLPAQMRESGSCNLKAGIPY